MTAKVPSISFLGARLFSQGSLTDTAAAPEPAGVAAAKPSSTTSSVSSLEAPATSGLHSLSSPKSPVSAHPGGAQLALKGWDVLPTSAIPTLSTHPLPACLENVPKLEDPVFWHHSRGAGSRFENWDVNIRSFHSPSPRHALQCVRHVLIDEGMSGNHATLHIHGFADHRSSSSVGGLRSPLSLSRSFSSLSSGGNHEPSKFHVAIDVSKFISSRPTCLVIPSYESVEHLLEHCHSLTVLKTPPGVDVKHADHYGAEISLQALADELAKECELLGFKHQVRVSVEMQHSVTHLTFDPPGSSAGGSATGSIGDGIHHSHGEGGVKAIAKEIASSLGEIFHHALGSHDFRWEKSDVVARCSWIPTADVKQIVEHIMSHARAAVVNCVHLEAEGLSR